MRALGLWACLILGAAACVEEAAQPMTSSPAICSPAQGPMSGYFRVALDLGDQVAPETVTSIRFGEVPAYGISIIDASTLEVWVQGHPSPGPVDVVVGGGQEPLVFSDAFTFESPRLPAYTQLHAVGASLTQGTQRGLPTQWSILQGPAAQLARQLGLYFPLPMLIAEGFQEMTPDLIGPPPYCQPPALDAYQMSQALELIPQLSDPETDTFSFQSVRVTPELEPHNLAVGGSRVSEALDGPVEGDVALEFLSHMVYEPEGTIGDPISRSQMEVLESAGPELVVSFDLLGNDLIDGMIDNADFRLTEMTPREAFLADIDRGVSRLAATGAQVFLANLPNPIELPFFLAKRARLAEEGLTENATLVFAEIDAGVVEGNARLEAQAARYDNVHVVDIAGRVTTWLAEGVAVGDQRLYVEQYGGLIGLDGLHFSDTAYALIANAFIEVINEVTQSSLALIDVAEVWALDRERPEALRDAGLDPEVCQGQR